VASARASGYGAGVSQPVKAYHLPGRVATMRLAAGAVEIEVPRLDAGRLRDVLGAARAAGATLRTHSRDEVLARLDRVVANWLDPEHLWRRRALQLLPQATGFSAAMVAHGLPLLVEPLRAPAVGALLAAELGGRTVQAPELLMHVLSGNIPGLAMTPVLLSLALQSAVLVKSAAGDPIFPALLAESIAAVDETLGRCIVVAPWRGGDVALEAVAFAAADVVVASGSDAAIAAIAPRVPGRFIGHGHKVSFAAIGAECLAHAADARELAHRLAYDVSLWDQQGCLSPQLCYVETGGRISPAQFAELLAEGLTRWAHELPPRSLSLAEQVAVLRFRQAAEWAGRGATALLASADGLQWSVSLESDAIFLPTCLNRCLRLKVIDDLAVLPSVLTPHRRHLEAAGIATGSHRTAAVTDMLAAAGVHRICEVGMMQRPSLSWRQGGRPRVADWVA